MNTRVDYIRIEMATMAFTEDYWPACDCLNFAGSFALCVVMAVSIM